MAWLSARSSGGRITLRIEDLDEQRAIPALARSLADDLAWLGLEFDASPDIGGPHAPYLQSARGALYEKALHRLFRRECLFPCTVSRKMLRSLASAPHGPSQQPPYPASLRPGELPAGWFHRTEDVAVRFQVPDREVAFSDRLYGPQAENVACTVGDFVLKRRDGLFAYQLAVVVDDLQMGITEVVRGEDLLASTARQILLIEALGGTRPVYGHVPLVLDEYGQKLSKRDVGLTIQALRTAGTRPEQIIGYLAYSLGLSAEPSPRMLGELVRTFSWRNIAGTKPWRLPPNLASTLRYHAPVHGG